MAPITKDVAFDLERFGWSSPEQLEVVGRWSGLDGRRLGSLILIVNAEGRAHRLSGAAVDASPDEEAPWRATFAWKGQPLAVEDAQLEVGREFIVALPPPRSRRARFSRGASEETRRHATIAEHTEEPTVAQGTEPPTTPADRSGPVDPTTRSRCRRR